MLTKRYTFRPALYCCETHLSIILPPKSFKYLVLLFIPQTKRCLYFPYFSMHAIRPTYLILLHLTL